MEVKIYESITDIDEEAWDSIVDKNRLICRHKYIKAIEKSNINDCRFYYLVAYEGGEIAGHTSVYFISTELDTFLQGPAKKIVNAIRKIWKNFFILRTIECGTPIAPGNTISVKHGRDHDAVLKSLCEGIERLAKKLGIKIVLFRDFYDEELESFDYFIKSGYTKIHNLPGTRLTVRWKTFGEYLDSMRSQYKYKVIKRSQRCKKHITIEIINEFSGYAHELEKLWTNVYNNAKEYKRERLKALFFANINRYLPDRSAIILAKKEGMPVGFAFLLFDDETLIPLFFGLDYDHNNDNYVYFNLMYKAVEVGIAHGMKEIDMGITTLIPKKDIGFSVITMNMFMKHFNPMLNRIMPRLFDSMTPQDTTPPRRVFREKVSVKAR